MNCKRDTVPRLYLRKIFLWLAVRGRVAGCPPAGLAAALCMAE